VKKELIMTITPEELEEMKKRRDLARAFEVGDDDSHEAVNSYNIALGQDMPRLIEEVEKLSAELRFADDHIAQMRKDSDRDLKLFQKAEEMAGHATLSCAEESLAGKAASSFLTELKKYRGE
jgi:hypothetical protein